MTTKTIATPFSCCWRRTAIRGLRLPSGGNEAIALLGKERFSLVLLDMMMPGMNGDEVLRIIKNDPQTRRYFGGRHQRRYRHGKGLEMHRDRRGRLSAEAVQSDDPARAHRILIAQAVVPRPGRRIYGTDRAGEEKFGEAAAKRAAARDRGADCEPARAISRISSRMPRSSSRTWPASGRSRTHAGLRDCRLPEPAVHRIRQAWPRMSMSKR